MGKDRCNHYVYGNKCELKSGNGQKQRTAFCVGDGKSTYQSILGGLNGDGYSVKHGPCMCDLKSMCGSCKSMNAIEIYPVYKPFEPTKLALDKYSGVRIARDESLISF